MNCPECKNLLAFVETLSWRNYYECRNCGATFRIKHVEVLACLFTVCSMGVMMLAHVLVPGKDFELYISVAVALLAALFYLVFAYAPIPTEKCAKRRD